MGEDAAVCMGTGTDAIRLRTLVMTRATSPSVLGRETCLYTGAYGSDNVMLGYPVDRLGAASVRGVTVTDIDTVGPVADARRPLPGLGRGLGRVPAAALPGPRRRRAPLVGLVTQFDIPTARRNPLEDQRHAERARPSAELRPARPNRLGLPTTRLTGALRERSHSAGIRPDVFDAPSSWRAALEARPGACPHPSRHPSLRNSFCYRTRPGSHWPKICAAEARYQPSTPRRWTATPSATPGPTGSAGRSQQGAHGAGSCGPARPYKSSTGAPVPAGATGVLRLEDAIVEGDVVHGPHLTSGRHIRRAGEDATTGLQLALAGFAVGPAMLGLAAACGHDNRWSHPDHGSRSSLRVTSSPTAA
jgi:hypothetical protein